MSDEREWAESLPNPEMLPPDGLAWFQRQPDWVQEEFVETSMRYATASQRTPLAVLRDLLAINMGFRP